MSLSRPYLFYLQGYGGHTQECMDLIPTERQLQAFALGVHHRTTSRAPLMSSVAVTAELRALAAVKQPQPTSGQLSLLSNEIRLVGGVDASTKIPIIKAVREITGLGLKEAKDIVDDVQSGTPRRIFCRAGRLPLDAQQLRDVGCVVEVS